jgi:hypothetical protein
MGFGKVMSEIKPRKAVASCTVAGTLSGRSPAERLIECVH